MSQKLQLLVKTPDIQKRVNELAREIDAKYPASCPGCKDADRLIMICVLKGAFIFFSDLVRNMRSAPALDFTGLSSYGLAAAPGQNIKLTIETSIPIKGRDVLIVEDIVDSGHSMKFLLDKFLCLKPKSLGLCALIDKRERRETDIDIDFTGFKLNGFIVGYGLDYAEQYRELPALYSIAPDKN